MNRFYNIIIVFIFLLNCCSQKILANQNTSIDEISKAKVATSIEYPPVYPPAMTADETTLYFTDGDGMVTATSLASDTLWIYETPGHLRFSPTIGYNGTIYCAGGSGSLAPSTWLTALHPDGSLKWELDLGSCSISPIAVTPDGMIYVATEDSLIHGIKSDSTILWSCQVQGRYYRELIVGPDGTLYATSGSTNEPSVYAIDIAGQILWECGLPDAVSGSGYLVWGGDVLYYFDYYGVEIDGENVGVSDGLYAVNLDGTLRWHRTEPTITTQITVGKDYLYTMGEYATLFILSKDGILQWERQLSETNWHRSSIQPVFGDNGIIYVADRSGDYVIHAVTLENELLWTQEISFDSMILDSNGTLHAFHGRYHNTLQTTSSGLDADAIWPCEGGNYQRTYCVMEYDPSAVSSDRGPSLIELFPAKPNPFNPQTTITYVLPEAMDVTLSVYSVTGQQVAVLVDDFMSAGTHSVVFDGEHMASGVYFYTLESAEVVESGKMLLIK